MKDKLLEAKFHLKEWKSKTTVIFLMSVCILCLLYSGIIYIYEIIRPQSGNLHFLKEGGRNFYYLGSNIISYMIGRSGKKADSQKSTNES